CADLIVAALDCAVADFRCVRARDATLLLGEFEVFLPTEIMFDTPPRPLLYQIAKLAVGKFEKTVSADSGWDTLEKPIDDFFQARSHIFVCEIRLDQAHAAVDVESNSAGRDHTALMHVHSCDAADRKSVTAVAVSHAQRVACYAWQGRDVTDLLINGFIHFAYQFFCGDDPRRHAHALFVGRGQLPNCV